MKQGQNEEIELWGLERSGAGELGIHGRELRDIARRYGTPLHVVDRARLRSQAQHIARTARIRIGASARIHYACKCNGVPGVLREIHDAGLNIEVMSHFELASAIQAGFSPDQIIVNGPCKTETFLRECLCADVNVIVLDSLEELERLHRTAEDLGLRPAVLLRVNPDIRIPGLNAGSSTGSRKRCAFGLDIRSGEVEAALDMLKSCALDFRGYHAHIGTNIREPLAYSGLVGTFGRLIRLARTHGHAVSVLDLGGGFPSVTSREFRSLEMLAYQAMGRLPSSGPPPPPFERYVDVISGALRSIEGTEDLGSIILEPGRSIVSNAQLLLLSVEYIKRRPGTETWVITDGGLGTVTLPTYYEYHEVIPCSRHANVCSEQVTILGPGCFAADIVIRNKFLPQLSSGDVIAVMDSGAYFTSLESNFSYPRPPVLAVDDHGEYLWRRRENHEDYTQRDCITTYSHEVPS